MTCLSSEATKKYPERVRNTSTPPDTRPNQTWKMATSAMAQAAQSVEVVTVGSALAARLGSAVRGDESPEAVVVEARYHNVPR